ncbi:MAG: AAA family ATPase [Planctomycetes bacterium]|nr:AAA family ATPase [Planctomycetota bacterium]
MLIELFGRNFGSFRDEFHLSMLATDIDPGNPRGVVEVLLEGEDEPLRLLRCAAIYGPNASGKSTVLQAAAALWYMLASSAFMPSDRPLAPFEPFLLDNKSKSEPIKLGIRAVVDARVYEYLVEYDQKKIVLERLTEFAPDQPELLFERREGDVEGPWTNDKQFVLLAESFRSNALLLSLADRLAPKLAKGLATGFGRLLNHHDPTWNRHPSFDAKRAARQASMDRAGFGAWLLGWLKDADVGIVGYETKEMKPADESAGENLGSGPNVREDQEMEFQLFHDGVDGPIGFNCRRESEGTRRIVELLNPA